MKIYTKTGDKGMTSLVGGTRVSKASLRLDTYGTVDELNSFIGLFRSKIEGEAYIEILSILQTIQNKLFNLGAYLASDSQHIVPDNIFLQGQDITYLEEAIDRLSADLPSLRGFILPAGNERVALAHICRTITRRLERKMVELHQESATKNQASRTKSQEEISLKYVNRLSDFWFILSRKVAQIDECDVFLWEK